MRRAPLTTTAILVGVAIFAHAADDPILDAVVADIERAVVTGDVETLAACREALDAVPDADAGLVAYTRAYVDWRIGTQTPGKQGQQILKRAEAELTARVEDAPDDAESWALLGSVYGARITGAFKGMRLGPKSGKALDRAEELAPDNPRVALQRGINRFRTPASFGGGTDLAVAALQRAAELYEVEPPDAPWPSWGRVDVDVWLGQVLADTGDIDGARAAYQRVLEVEPDHAWVRDELLPGLDAAAD